MTYMTQQQRLDYGYNLRVLRIAIGLSQREVAEACSTATRTVQYWECGRQLPGVDRIRALAAVLQVPINQIVP